MLLSTLALNSFPAWHSGVSSQDCEFREPSKLELDLLVFLLNADFPDVARLRAQLVGLKVKSLDEDGCLALQPEGLYPAERAIGIPVEASYAASGVWDEFGPKIHVLLRVGANGFMNELEFYSDQPDPITWTDLQLLHLHVNSSSS